MRLTKMCRIALSLCLICVCQLGFAQTIKVRTAEHPGFTRIVLDTRDTQNFVLRQSNETLQVSKPGTRLEFDLTGAFRRLSEGRIARLRSVSGRLEIDLSCDCRARPLQKTPGMLIVDVEPITQGVAILSQLKFGLTPPSSRVPFPPKRTLSFANLEIRQTVPHFESSPPTWIPEQQKETNLPMATDFTKLRTTRQLATLKDELDLIHATKDKQPRTVGLPAQVNVILPKNLQLDPLVAEKFFLTKNNLHCEELSAFDPANWGSHTKSLAHLGQLYSLVTDEKGRFSPEQAMDLAQTYLALAMGAEARSVLQHSPFPEKYEQQLSVARYISKLLDGGGQPPTTSSAASSTVMPDCPQLKAWLLLNGDKSVDDTIVTTLRSEFVKWPGPVQGALAASFAQLLSDEAYPDAALFVLTEAENDPEHETGAIKLVRSRIELAHGDRERAKTKLSSLVKEQKHVAPDSLATLVEAFPSYAGQKSEETQTRLALYAHEKSGSLQEAQLVRAQVTLALANRDYAKAIAVLDARRAELRPSLVNMLIDRIGEAILQDPSDVMFLNAKIGIPSHIYARFTTEQQNKMESRTKEIGFPELAGAGTNGARGQAIGQQSEENIAGSKADADRANSKNALRSGATQAVNQHASTKPRDTIDRKNDPELELAAPVARAIEASEDVLEDVDVLISEIEKLRL